MRLLFLIVTVLTLFIGCSDSLSDKERAKIYEGKGFNEMKSKKKRLKPEIIKYKKTFYELAEVSIPNTVATIDGNGSFALMELDEKAKIIINPIMPGFPGVPGTLGSDSEHNLLWVIRGRGLYFLDIESKATGHVVVNNDGNSKVMQVFLLDAEKKLIMITTAAPECGTSFYIYDLLNDKLEDVALSLANVFKFNNNRLLVKHSEVGWLLTDYYFKDAGAQKQDSLTKELNKFNINLWHKTKTVDLNRRMLLGSNMVGDKLIYYSVRWDEDMEEVKVEPLILQQPKDSIIHTDFTFSANGNWVQTLYTKRSSFPQLTELIIYHAASVYPQGLSMPIYCGYTKEGNESAFMQHDQWGPVFIERDQDMRDKLFIYKLNDGLEILKAQALNIIPAGDEE